MAGAGMRIKLKSILILFLLLVLSMHFRYPYFNVYRNACGGIAECKVRRNVYNLHF